MEGVRVAKILGLDGNTGSLVLGAIFNKSEEHNMPKGLHWCWCSVYSKVENVLLEDSMSETKQLREDQGKVVFNQVMKSNLASRDETLKHPALKTTPTIEAVDKAVKAHRDALAQKQRDMESAARGEDKDEGEDEDDEEEVRPGFRMAGLASLGAIEKKKAAPKQVARAASKAVATSDKQARGQKRLFPSSPTPSVGAAPSSDAGASAGSPQASARLSLEDQASSDWKKVSVQGLLDVTDTLGKKLNGVTEHRHVIADRHTDMACWACLFCNCPQFRCTSHHTEALEFKCSFSLPAFVLGFVICYL